MFEKRTAFLAVLLLVGVIFSPRSMIAEDTQSKLRVAATDEGYGLFEGDTPVLFYQANPRSLDGKYERAGYVHPLYDLDGQVLTEDFPADHLHHRGIFWAWHQLYVGDTQIGDPWVCRNFLSRVDDVEILKTEPDSAAIQATVHWVSPDWKDSSGETKPIVREVTTITAYRAADGFRAIDFRIRLTALEPDVRIGGSDDVKGYGGFSPRLRLPQDIQFIAEYGQVEPQKTAVKASRWMDMVGSFVSGSDNAADRVSGVAVLCHPSLPGFPQQWILRKARSMQNPVFPGREPVAVPFEKPLEFRYRMVIHRGNASQQQLKTWFNQYAAGK